MTAVGAKTMSRVDMELSYLSVFNIIALHRNKIFLYINHVIQNNYIILHNTQRLGRVSRNGIIRHANRLCILNLQ